MLLERGCDYFCAWIGTMGVGVGHKFLLNHFPKFTLVLANYFFFFYNQLGRLFFHLKFLGPHINIYIF